MRVAVIFLDYQRHEYTQEVLTSLQDAGHPFDMVTVQRYGIAAATNEGLRKTLDYDAVVVCANDIKMPKNWLAKMVDYARAIPNTGMAGIHCVQHEGETAWVNGYEIGKTIIPFGNVLITRAAIDAVGGFQTAFDPYGVQDHDYGFRTTQMGFLNYYIRGARSIHLGNDVGQNSDYRKMKDEGLKKVFDIAPKVNEAYQKSYYIDLG